MKGKILNLSFLSFTFLIFVYSGAIKGAFFFSNFEFDLTLIGFLVVLSSLFFILIRNHFYIPYTFLFAFSIFFLFSIPLLWTDFTDYATRKTLQMFSLTALAALFPAIYFKKPSDIKEYLNSILILALFLCGNAIYAFFNAVNIGQFIALSTDYIIFSRICGVAFIYTIILLLNEQSKSRSFLFAIIAIVLLFSIISTGARGPLIALFCSIILLFYFLFKTRKDNLGKIIISTLIMSFLFTFFLSKAPKSSSNRIKQIVFEHDFSSFDRPNIFKKAIDYSLTSFWGSGWGGFEKIGSDNIYRDKSNYFNAIRSYPHNIFLEILSEAGWLIAIIFIIILIILFRSISKNYNYKNEIEFLSLYIILFFLMLASMSSNDFNDNRDFFSFIGISIAYIFYGYSEKRTPIKY